MNVSPSVKAKERVPGRDKKPLQSPPSPLQEPFKDPMDAVSMTESKPAPLWRFTPEEILINPERTGPGVEN